MRAAMPRSSRPPAAALARFSRYATVLGPVRCFVFAAAQRLRLGAASGRNRPGSAGRELDRVPCRPAIQPVRRVAVLAVRRRLRPGPLRALALLARLRAHDRGVGRDWLARRACSASMALICARMGTRIGEPGDARVRLTSRWQRARSSSSSVIPLTSLGRLSGTGHPLADGVIRCGHTPHAGQHVTFPAPEHGLGLPRPPGPCLSNTRPRQFQPTEERRNVFS